MGATDDISVEALVGDLVGATVGILLRVSVGATDSVSVGTTVGYSTVLVVPTVRDSVAQVTTMQLYMCSYQQLLDMLAASFQPTGLH